MSHVKEITPVISGKEGDDPNGYSRFDLLTTTAPPDHAGLNRNVFVGGEGVGNGAIWIQIGGEHDGIVDPNDVRHQYAYMTIPDAKALALLLLKRASEAQSEAPS